MKTIKVSDQEKISIRTIGVMLFGNMLELLEFSLYGIFSKVFSTVFFNNEKYGLLFSLGIFSCGFFSRPVGAIIFGHIGDKYGRRPALIFSIILMTIATLGIGLLPASDKIGLWAPMILLLLRILQGISCGGEYIGITVYLFERYPAKTGFASSLAAISGMSGTLGAISLSIMAYTYISSDWNWRIPFLISPFFGMLALYLRVYFLESKAYETTKSRNEISTYPLKDVFKKYPLELITTIFIGGGNGVLTFTLIVYLNIFLTSFTGHTLDYALKINFIAVCFFIMSGLSLGIIKDRYRLSATTLLLIISSAVFIVAPFIYRGLLTNNNQLIIASEVILGSLAGSFSACCNMCMCQLFPSNVRYSGVAFGYSVGVSLFGGTVPLLSSLLIEVTHQPSMAFACLSLGSFLGIGGFFMAWKASKSKQYSLRMSDERVSISFSG